MANGPKRKIDAAIDRLTFGSLSTWRRDWKTRDTIDTTGQVARGLRSHYSRGGGGVDVSPELQRVMDDAHEGVDYGAESEGGGE